MNGSKEVQSRLARDLSRANFLPPTYDCNTSRQQGISCPLNEHLTCTSRNPNLKHSQKASMLPWEPLLLNAFAYIVNVQQVLSLHKQTDTLPLLAENITSSSTPPLLPGSTHPPSPCLSSIPVRDTQTKEQPPSSPSPYTWLCTNVSKGERSFYGSLRYRCTDTGIAKLFTDFPEDQAACIIRLAARLVS